MIHIQIESAKQYKIEGSSSTRRRLPATVNTTNEGKKNLNPQIILIRKKKKIGKKAHNLNKNILKNQSN